MAKLDAKKEVYDSKEAEPRLQIFWEKQGVYKFDPKSKKKIFSIDTPPPYISGRPHMGHAYSYALFDVIARFKRMNGFNVLLPIGFDDNGHPTERYVEKKHGISSADVSREEFIKLCRKETGILEKEAKKDLVSLGLGFDWSLFYSTIGDQAIKTAQFSFLDLHKKKLVYRGEEPGLWCTRCKTALAQADVEDATKNTLLNYIKFKLSNGKDLMFATTRPEFLAACVGIFVHPNDKRYKKLIGKEVTVPIFENKVKVRADEKVDPEFGTGVVMICTFGDKTDIDWWKSYKLPLKIILTEEGKLNKLGGKYEGLYLNQARKKILEDLKEKCLLEKQENLEQNVGVCWRCHTPIEFIVTKQWRVKLLDYKDKFIEFGRKIEWHPKFFLKRYENWVNGLNWDWIISRQRHYGVPMPVWYCEKCGREVVADEKQLPVNPLKDKPKKKCSCGGGKFKPEKDVLDTWFTSSLTPEIVLGWANKDKLFSKNFPEDLRPQGYEIIRTWTFYTIVKSFYHFKKIPWKNIMVNGMVLDPKGKAMHKSAGNVIAPFDVLERHSADSMRFFALSNKFGDDVPFQEKELVAGHKTTMKLWNATKFVMQDISNKKPKKFEGFDLWLLTKLNSLIKENTENFNKYEISRPKLLTEQFFWHVFSDDYLEIVKNRIYNGGKEEKQSAQYTLHKALLTILKLFAPIIPHITEELYQKHFKITEKSKSIHISEWPKVEKVDVKFEKGGDKAIEVIHEVRRFKSQNGKSLKVPIVLTLDKKDEKGLKPFLEDLKAVTAAQEVKFGKFKIEFAE